MKRKSPAELLRVRGGQLGIAASDPAVEDNHRLWRRFGIDVWDVTAGAERHRTDDPEGREDREAHPDIYRCHHAELLSSSHAEGFFFSELRGNHLQIEKSGLSARFCRVFVPATPFRPLIGRQKRAIPRFSKARRARVAGGSFARLRGEVWLVYLVRFCQFQPS